MASVSHGGVSYAVSSRTASTSALHWRQTVRSARPSAFLLPMAVRCLWVQHVGHTHSRARPSSPSLCSKAARRSCSAVTSLLLVPMRVISHSRSLAVSRMVARLSSAPVVWVMVFGPAAAVEPAGSMDARASSIPSRLLRLITLGCVVLSAVRGCCAAVFPMAFCTPFLPLSRCHLARSQLACSIWRSSSQIAASCKCLASVRHVLMSSRVLRGAPSRFSGSCPC
mmetsp:Transcript_18341/g.45003  ORF Transcript_18341/g.45003 Transcript_18341/m.45003 type:complete len:225 (+) Transcript_18341:727-1401(+)